MIYTHIIKAFGTYTYAVSYIRDATIYRYTHCHIMIHQAVTHTYIIINTHLGCIYINVLPSKCILIHNYTTDAVVICTLWLQILQLCNYLLLCIIASL